jgi:alkyl hydroperoxide reductase subunit AhpC
MARHRILRRIRPKLTIAYTTTAGRNFNEALRVLESLQPAAKHKVSTPVNSRAAAT